MTNADAVKGTPALWVAEQDGGRVHFLGGRLPLPFAWTAPDAEALIDSADEFWHEVPSPGDELLGLVARYGVDPEAPLASWISADELARVHAAADSLGVAPEALAPFRPWLAGQMLKLASQSRRGMSYDTSPEDVFRSRADRAGIPIFAEFESTESLVQLFTKVPPRAEIEMLLMDVEDIDEDSARDEARAQAWLNGDLEQELAWADEFSRKHPMMHEHLGVARNRDWVPRVEKILDRGTAAFIVVGMGHMLGRGSVPEQLAAAGIELCRV